MPATQFTRFIRNLSHLVAAMLRNKKTGEVVVILHNGEIKGVRVVNTQTFAPDKLPNV